MVAYCLRIVAVMNEALHKVAVGQLMQLFDVTIPCSIERIQTHNELHRRKRLTWIIGPYERRSMTRACLDSVNFEESKSLFESSLPVVRYQPRFETFSM